jgi:protein-L-isoaspartate(D-aspartate) O-methyltransferase
MNFEDARYRMIQHQVRTNRITDPLVIAAMSELPRERFVPEHLRGVAYIDDALALSSGRFINEPLTTALMLQAAEIGPNDIALEVGCATGYSLAIMARMASAVVGLESNAELAAVATATLADFGLSNATVVSGPLHEGWPAQAPYDVILFGGAVSEVPARIVEQLADGGRLIAVIAGSKGVGCGTLFLRSGGCVSERPLFDASVPLLPDFAPEPTFRF